jgi:tRNA(adenine34) deaminase
VTDPSADTLFMSRALELARAAGAVGEVPVGAVVVRAGVVLTEGHNLVETQHDPTAHAEMMVIREAGQKLQNWRLEGCTLYVSLEPCPMCGMAIRLARFSRIVFGARDPRMGGAGSYLNLFHDSSIGPLPEVTEQVLADESSKLLRDFFRARRLR